MTPASRQASLAYRQSLPPQLHQDFSQQLCSRLLEEWTLLRSGPRPIRVVAGFRGVRGEPDLTGFYRQLKNVTLVFPRVTAAGTLTFHATRTLDDPSEWRPGPFGIAEPNGLEEIAPSALDWILVPGLLFSPRGARVGHGKGYYDRFLATAPQALRTGIAFDAQIFDQVEQKPHDVVMHSVVTQSQVIHVSPRKE